MTDGRLSGKVAIVTGAAFGDRARDRAAVSRRGCPRRGWDRDEPALAKAGYVGNERARTAGAEVSSQADAEATVAFAVQEFGSLDVLVNSAGIVRRSDLFDLPLDEWEEVQRVNATGTFLFSQAAARAMVDHPTPDGTTKSIVNLASIEAIAVLASSGIPRCTTTPRRAPSGC